MHIPIVAHVAVLLNPANTSVGEAIPAKYKNDEIAMLVTTKGTLGVRNKTSAAARVKRTIVLASITIIRLSAKGTYGVMKRGVLSLFLYLFDILVLESRHTTEPEEVSGGAV